MAVVTTTATLTGSKLQLGSVAHVAFERTSFAIPRMRTLRDVKHIGFYAVTSPGGTTRKTTGQLWPKR